MRVKDAVAEIKQKVNIVDYLIGQGLQLTSIGRGSWKGLCPFHSEKTPSFTVNEDFQNFHCFGCGTHGDLLSYLQYEHTISFLDAVKIMADKLGIVLDDTGESSLNLSSLQAIVQDAYDFYRKEFEKLPSIHPAKKEILNRNLSVNNEVYCYAPEKPCILYNYLLEKGHCQEDIFATELCSLNKDGKPFDFFRGRLLFCIRDFMGNPITFTSRKIYESDNLGKYVNGRDSKLFHKDSILFNSHNAKNAARKQNKIIITEGQFDVLSLMSLGIKNVVASSGTAFTNKHANLVSRLVGEEGEIIFCFDGDKAGIEAAIKVFKEHPQIHSKSKVCFLPNGKDPCDFVIENRGNEILTLLSEAIPIYEWILKLIFAKNKPDSQKIKELIKSVAYAKDSIVSSLMLKRISVLTATHISILSQALNEIKIKPSQVEEIQFEKLEEEESTLEIDLKNKVDECFIRIIALIVRDPNLFKTELNSINFPKKFYPFLKEWKKDFSSNQHTWRFIKEKYSDERFVELLQSIEFLPGVYENKGELTKYFKSLIKMGNLLQLSVLSKKRKANALSSLQEDSNMEEVAKALEIIEQ